MAMTFITGNAVVLRRLILALLVVAMLGPWAFDLLNVPAQYPCEKPSVRLYGDFCGAPMSGFGALAWIFSGLFDTLTDVIRGNIAVILPDLLALLFVCIVVFPFLSTLLLLWKKTLRPMQILNLIVWGLACLASFSLFFLLSNREQFALFFYLYWGILLYIVVASSAVFFEVWVFRSSLRPRQIT